MNNYQFQGSTNKKKIPHRAGKKTSKQRARKEQQLEDYYHNIVIIDTCETNVQVASLKPQNCQSAVVQVNNQKVQKPVASAVRANIQKLQPPPVPAPVVPAQKSALQLEMERKFYEVVNKKKELQLHTQLMNNTMDFTADVTIPDANKQERQPVAANKQERQPVAANKQERQPVAANKQERQPVAANKQERQPVAANKQERQPVAANKQQRQPVSANKQQGQPVVANNNTSANKKGNKKKRPPQNRQIVYHHGTQNQFQAPHQDEPEDLTDDLAPNMAGQGAPQQTTQPATATSENKLNFKFQRSTLKNPDWSEFQNKFRRIGGGSPDNDDDAPEIKQEKDKDQSENTGSDDNPLVSIPPIAGPSSQLKAEPPQAVVAPRVELLHGVAANKSKPTDATTKSTGSRFDQKPQYNFPGFVNPYENYPKGIPKSFLVRQDIQYNLNEPAVNPPQSNTGVPKSLLNRQDSQWLDERAMSSPQTPVVEPEYQTQAATIIDLPSWITPGQVPRPTSQHNVYEEMAPNVGAKMPAYVPQEPTSERAYSPSDVYSESGRAEDETREGSESPDLLQPGQKRLSAFKRLGPLTQPKKPKLTINLTLNKEQAVREVVDETDESSPVHLRKDIIESEDDIVKKYLPLWPWKKNLGLRKTVSARFSKSVMILEQEQMEAGYEKDNVFIQVSVKGYPKTWTKEHVLDAVLECVKGKTFIPLFIEFTPEECKFLVIRCRAALIAIHKVGFCIRKDDVELTVSISLTDTSLNQIDLIPRLVLRKRLMSRYDGEKSLDLKDFIAQKDASHFVYFPLNRVTNQLELLPLLGTAAWEYLTQINLSHNRITTLDGFNLCMNTPKLKHLDLSYNYLDRVTNLIPLKELPLRSLKLEGNPLCHDYIDSEHYIKVVKMIFSEVMELDGVRIPLKGDLLPTKRNYCPEPATPVVEKYLETFFPLLEAPHDDRAAIEDMYDKEAVMTITFRSKLRYGTAYRYFRNLFLRSRCLEEGEMESVKGAATIGTLINKWPALQHDRHTITVDVLHHDESTTILRTGGVLKLIAETLAEDEHLLQFNRTVVLYSRNGVEYKIRNEMLYWDVPCEEVMQTAFNITTVRPRQLSLKLESPPDDEMRKKLLDIFMKVADIGRKRARRCLELKNYDLRSALEFFITLIKHDNLKVLKDNPPEKIYLSNIKNI